jgi:hypothetical protein
VSIIIGAIVGWIVGGIIWRATRPQPPEVIVIDRQEIIRAAAADILRAVREKQAAGVLDVGDDDDDDDDEEEDDDDVQDKLKAENDKLRAEVSRLRSGRVRS